MDIATSATAEGKVQVYRNAGRTMPEGMIIDAQGHPSTDPNDVLSRSAASLPFGGVNGHKGYCLAVMADLLSAGPCPAPTSRARREFPEPLPADRHRSRRRSAGPTRCGPSSTSTRSG